MDQADELLGKYQNIEVYHRSAISRGYYSLFHEAFDFLSRGQYRTNLIRVMQPQAIQHPRYDPARFHALDHHHLAQLGLNLHKAVNDAFYDIGNIAARGIADDIRDFRRLRNRADYDIHNPFNNHQTKRQLREMKSVIQHLSNI